MGCKHGVLRFTNKMESKDLTILSSVVIMAPAHQDRTPGGKDVCAPLLLRVPEHFPVRSRTEFLEPSHRHFSHIWLDILNRGARTHVSIPAFLVDISIQGAEYQ